MNPDTGHLVALDGKTEKEILTLKRDGYEPVPKRLSRAAIRKLNGKNEAQVSLTSGGKLSKFAAQKRKRKRKAQNKSRKANR